jgi:hypothetical protein
VILRKNNNANTIKETRSPVFNYGKFGAPQRIQKILVRIQKGQKEGDQDDTI